jgi:hypothetical protein
MQVAEPRGGNRAGGLICVADQGEAFFRSHTPKGVNHQWIRNVDARPTANLAHGEILAVATAAR